MSGKNVLNNTLDVNNKVNRSPFDKSYQNNLTLNIGQIVPTFCQLCPPGTSVKINPTFALQFMPMVFPIQTRMRAQLSFYKVPLRTLWKDYTDFVGNFKKGLVPPYLDISTEESLKAHASTGSLGDYFNVPTTIVGEFGGVSEISVRGYANNTDYPFYTNLSSSLTVSSLQSDILGKNIDNIVIEATQPQPTTPWFAVKTPVIKNFLNSVPGSTTVSITTKLDDGATVTGSSILQALMIAYVDKSGKVLGAAPAIAGTSSGKLHEWKFNIPSMNLKDVASFALFIKNNPAGTFCFDTVPPTWQWTWQPLLYPSLSTGSVSDITLASSPYYNSTSSKKADQIPLSAFPFRAYEAVYNAYYRDNRNNPYVLNGQLEYNKWIPTDAGGADTTIYKIRYKNWEQDFLTTAVQSPQQGIAPLVGLTTYTETLENGQQQAAVSIVDELGKSYKVKFTGDGNELTDVSYEPLDPTEKGTLQQPRSLQDLYSTGISISDLRYVNSYQKYLEMNMRKGYSYRDVIKGHFDTNVRFDALMLPEYLGGVTQDVNMNSIVQTVETNNSGSYAGALGSMAGNATVRGSSHPVSCYCDEESYIIGLLSVSPVPNYSQLLPKHFLHRDLLDSYYPEFDNIGFQPITYKEVCPVQAFNSDPKSLSTTFGYQRAYYDYITQVDEVHGLFRTNLRNFLINRVFDVKPELAESFLLINEKQVNDVFSVTESSDKIFGQIWFDYTAKLPISRTSIPKLD